MVRKIADYLVGHHHMRWANNHDWTQINEEDIDPKGHEAALLWAQDLASAVAADLFVHLVMPGVTSHGSHAELGARCATGREANVVLLEGADWHICYLHPNVVLHDSLEDFAATMNGRITTSSGRLSAIE